jgi:hypothetical protein
MEVVGCGCRIDLRHRQHTQKKQCEPIKQMECSNIFENGYHYLSSHVSSSSSMLYMLNNHLTSIIVQTLLQCHQGPPCSQMLASRKYTMACCPWATSSSSSYASSW